VDEKMSRLIKALSPAMPASAAEVCVRGAAISARKPVEALCAEDLPALEASVRSTLRGVTSEVSIELTILSLRQIFLESSEGMPC
jgi:hypothetical protein